MGIHWSRRRIAACLAGLLLAAAVAFLASRTDNGANAAGRIPPSASVLSHYSVFSRAAGASDALPAASLIRARPAAEGTLTRRVSQSASDGEWATLDGEQLCVIARSSNPSDGLPVTNRSCAGAGELEAQHQLLLQLSVVGSTSSTPPAPGTANLITGLAPDGVASVTLVSADGTEQSVPVRENGFMDHLDSPKNFQHLTWMSPAGTTVSGQ